MLAERLAGMLVVTFTAFGLHTAIVAFRVSGTLVLNHANLLAVDALSAALLSVMVSIAIGTPVAAALTVVCETALLSRVGFALFLGRSALPLIKLLTGLLGLFAGRPATAEFLRFVRLGALLLMETGVLFATLVVALPFMFVAMGFLDFRIFPTFLTGEGLSVVAPSELFGTTFGAVPRRLETLLVGIGVPLGTFIAIAALGFEGFAALVFTAILVAPAGTVRTPETITALGIIPAAPLAARIARRLGLFERPAEYRFGHFPYELKHFRGIMRHFDRLDLKPRLM